MNKRLGFLPLVTAVTILTLGAGMFSCKGRTKGEAVKDSTETVSPDTETMQHIKNAEKVFNALPTPLEIAQLIKASGAKFDGSLLNTVDNQSNYSTSKSMALNLGVYTCDLSFTSMYDETSLIISYMEAAENMAKGLGILDAIDETTIEKLEQNINNRDVIMEIVSETFLNSQSYLEDDEQHAVAATIIAGGFIEGLYISTHMVNMKDFRGNKLVATIADQKTSVSDLVKLLDSYNDNTAIQELIGPINELKTLFDKIERTIDPTSTDRNSTTGVTEITGSSKTEIKPDTFTAIRDKVDEIRNSYIK